MAGAEVDFGMKRRWVECRHGVKEVGGVDVLLMCFARTLLLVWWEGTRWDGIGVTPVAVLKGVSHSGLLSRASCHDGGCHYLISTSIILLQRALHICVFVDGWLLLQVADVSQVITHPQQKYTFCNSTYESGLLRARDAVKQPRAGH